MHNSSKMVREKVHEFNYLEQQGGGEEHQLDGWSGRSEV